MNEELINLYFWIKNCITELILNNYWKICTVKSKNSLHILHSLQFPLFPNLLETRISRISESKLLKRNCATVTNKSDSISRSIVPNLILPVKFTHKTLATDLFLSAKMTRLHTRLAIVSVCTRLSRGWHYNCKINNVNENIIIIFSNSCSP